MARKRFHGLKQIKIRQTWNKYNLYNLSRLRPQHHAGSTFFQQKWAAKAATRAYHGEHIKEGKWTRMFSRYIPAVVPMDAASLAQQGGTVESAGRGSGKDGMLEGVSRREMTPYMNNTYWMTERRLDTAIWRALFASSARQARQFVVHGHVKVNGKRMKHPSYLLNPGDMFTVDVESVLYATGAPKNIKDDADSPPDSKLSPAEEEDVIEEVAEEEDEEIEEPEEPEESEDKYVEEALQPNDAAIIKSRRTTLRDLHELAVTLQTSTKNLKPKRKIELRDLSVQTKRLLSKVRSVSADQITELEANFESVLAKIEDLSLGPNNKNGDATPSSFREIKTNHADSPPIPSKYRSKVAAAAAAKLDNHLSRLSLVPNPVDESKAYKTPWRPRDYMSPFAFVPRYLEVNHTVCSAVYLRHPVVRPGLAEVPTPFDLGIGSLAFAWYLRRR